MGLNKNRRAEFRRLLALLELGLEDRLEYPVKLLSGGQRQALTLLMATMGHPQILLLDEYTAALDPEDRHSDCGDHQTHRGTAQTNRAHGHPTTWKQALAMGNRTVMMDRGKIILDLEGPERENITVRDLLAKFTARSGRELTDDRILLHG